MALDQNAKYPVGTSPATAAYPEGSAVNSTAPGALDGYPLEKDQLNDRFGLEQALLRLTGQAASGVPDTALVSQYLQGVIELAQGRATNYDDSGAANAYVLDVQANQQAPAGLFDGQIFEFIAGNTNTTASTVNPVGTGVKNIVDTGVAGRIVAGERIRIRYRLGTTDFEIVNIREIRSATPIATTSGTSHDFTGIPSWVKRITVLFTGISTSGTSNPQIQLGDAGGVETSGYTGTVIRQGSSSNVEASLSAGFLLAETTGAATLRTGKLVLELLNGTWVATGMTGSTGVASGAIIIGQKTLSATLDRIRLTTVGGTDTFDAGSFNIFFE